MQAAIDRVLRTFALKHPVSVHEGMSLHEPMSDEQAGAVRDKATAFAAQLLDNYRDQLARRSLTRD
jgi:hypothetical protein